MSTIIDIKQLRQNHITKDTKKVLKTFGLPNNTRKEDISYAVFDLNGQVRKFGYTCPLMYIDYPIFLVINGEEKQIVVGKTGIYEAQFETTPAGEEITFEVSQVMLPVDVDFIFDYEIVVEQTACPYSSMDRTGDF